MANNSLLSRLAATLRSDGGPSAQDIDDEVESAVKAIDQAEIDTIDAEDVLDGDWDEAGAKVYILDLAPLYKMIGSRTGRLVAALRGNCKSAFSRHVDLGHGRAVFRGDHFFMRFTNMDETQRFPLAATIINEVGSRIFGDRFHPMEIPGLLVVAEVADILNEDGSLNSEMAAAVVQGGGLAVEMDEPGHDAPAWLSLRWNSVLGGVAAGPGDPTYSKELDRGPDPIPEWYDQKHQKRNTGQWRERGPDRRRKTSRNFMNGEKRKSWLGQRTDDNTGQVVQQPAPGSQIK